jgi:hypothetical protein
VIALVIAAGLSVTPPSSPHAAMPWRMGDWVTCRDETQFYLINPQFPLEPPMEVPCARHGGVRAFGPGKRLNER